MELPNVKHFFYFEMGWRAYERGDATRANPLHRDSIGGYLWLRGWKAARRYYEARA